MKNYWKYFLVIFVGIVAVSIAALIPVNNSSENSTEVKSSSTEYEAESIEFVEENVDDVDEEETFFSVVGTEMYSTTYLNVRTGPGLEYDVLTCIPMNTRMTVLDYSEDNEWNMIMYSDCFRGTISAYVCTKFISFEMTEIVEPTYDMVYYGIWSAEYYHFTPEEWDRKKGLAEGTTRAWQKYLYEKLSEKHIESFYKYAVAQAMQESGMNPNNNIDHSIISWLKGEATYDCGLFSFKTKYWNSAYGDVFDYKANINAYVDRIYPYLAGATSNADLYAAIAQHYDPYIYHQEYVNYVLGRINELWEMK